MNGSPDPYLREGVGITSVYGLPPPGIFAHPVNHDAKGTQVVIYIESNIRIEDYHVRILRRDSEGG